ASHSIRIFADDWRAATIARIGENPYKAVYSIVSLLALGAIVWGYGDARATSPTVWDPSPGLFTATAALMLVSMILLAGYFAKRSHLGVAVRHPMVWSVAALCAAHLLANGRLADIVLFGSLLVWSILDLASCYRRDRASGATYPRPEWRATAINLGLGVGFYVVFVLFLHRLLIGVSPMPGG
ncbi:MAG: NnrU family protein, partial [Tagaea sp.]|nr:NnrU family protein [Tagaea sp.]